MRGRRLDAALAVALALLAPPAYGQRPPSSGGPARPPWAAPPATRVPVALSSPGSLLGRFGMDDAMRLMRSSDADERLRGLERAAAMHTAEGIALLERAASASLAGGGLDPRLPQEGIARSDPRALLVVVRGLSACDNDRARATLVAIVAAPADFFAPRVASTASLDPVGDEMDGADRVKLARQEAAIALASTGGEIALEALVATARSGGAGQAAAIEALAIHPPASPLALGGVALTTPLLLALATRIADLRALDAIVGAVRASDPALRAAAMTALGAAGDTRGLEIARAAAHDADPRVRLAAGEALVRLGAPDAAPTVEALVADDATALEALSLAEDVQGEGVTKSAAARAVESADEAIRAAAVSALGRQASLAAVQALVALIADPLLQGDAAHALARSPSRDALPAIERLASARTADAGGLRGAARRLAARAYFVRRFVRGERSARLDALLESLAASGDAKDRAVGVQARVTLGELEVDPGLADTDPRVRRAAVLGVVGRWDSRTARRLLARAAIEPDDVTRHLLALGLSDGDVDEAVPSSELADRAGAGGPDAPLSAFALARRGDTRWEARVDTLLASRDPLLRAHAARGLGANRSPDAAGRLARAYEWEADATVRRAIVGALAWRPRSDAPTAIEGVLDVAARLDPDAETRRIATNALAGGRREEDPRAARVQDVAWIRLVPAEGAQGPRDEDAVLEESDGTAVPIVFDEDGYALVAGTPTGRAVLRLAPRLPAYTPPAP